MAIILDEWNLILLLLIVIVMRILSTSLYHLVVFLHYNREGECRCELSEHIEGYKQDAPQEHIVALEIVYSFQAATTEIEIESTRDHIGRNEYYTQDECIPAIVLIEHYDSLYIKQQAAHQQQGHYDLEYRYEVEDVLELLSPIVWQRNRVYKVYDHNED